MDKDMEDIYRGLGALIGPPLSILDKDGSVVWSSGPMFLDTGRPLPTDIGPRLLNKINEVMATKPTNDET